MSGRIFSSSLSSSSVGTSACMSFSSFFSFTWGHVADLPCHTQLTPMNQRILPLILIPASLEWRNCGRFLRMHQSKADKLRLLKKSPSKKFSLYVLRRKSGHESRFVSDYAFANCELTSEHFHRRFWEWTLQLPKTFQRTSVSFVPLTTDQLFLIFSVVITMPTLFSLGFALMTVTPYTFGPLKKCVVFVRWVALF